MRYLKNDEYILNPPILMSDYISRQVKRRITELPFADFLTNHPILVPIPNSSWMKPGTLWIAKRLTKAMLSNGFGKSVIEYLERINPLRKSATCSASNRPKAFEHYNSYGIRKNMFPEPEEILLIDDIVTRGATIIGAANKLHDAFPTAHIRAFAAMRTISSQNLKDIIDPCKGEICFRDPETFRDP